MRRWFTSKQSAQRPLLSDSEIRALIQSSACKAMVSERKAPTRGQTGNFISPRKGAGADIADLRSYEAGDSLRSVDWRASARSREMLVRNYLAEFSQPLILVVDRGAGMRFGTRTRPKIAQAARLAISLAACQVSEGQAVGAVLLDDPCHWLPAVQGAGQLQHLIDLANAGCSTTDGFEHRDWSRILAALRQRLPQGARLILISDFIGLDVSHRSKLTALGRAFNGTAVAITDPVEASMPSLPVELAWRQQRQVLDRLTAAELNLQLQQREKALQQLFYRAGIDSHVLSSTTEDVLSGVVL
ncbi:MAG: DUF58 domain-containing protein [Thiotrichales bacterium]